MAKLNNRQIVDMAKLATERASDGLASVTQLIEDDRQRYVLVLGVAANLLEVAALMMQDGIAEESGKRPDRNACIAHTFAHMAKMLGLKTKLLTKDEMMRELKNK